MPRRRLCAGAGLRQLRFGLRPGSRGSSFRVSDYRDVNNAQKNRVYLLGLPKMPKIMAEYPKTEGTGSIVNKDGP